MQCAIDELDVNLLIAINRNTFGNKYLQNILKLTFLILYIYWKFHGTRFVYIMLIIIIIYLQLGYGILFMETLGTGQV